MQHPAQATTMTDDAKWRAVTVCDSRFDGSFFYAVKTTGVFCRPSCTSRTPLRRNVRFFDTVLDAIQDGFRPCKRCRPELHDYDPGRELVERVKRIYASNFTDRNKTKNMLSGMSVSRNHLMRLFRQHEGCTQTQYLARVQIEHAQKLLRETANNILQISLSCGFESLSSFYKHFKDNTGTTPMHYRESRPCRTQ